MKRIYLAALSAMAVASFLSARGNRRTSRGSGSTEQDIRNAISRIRDAQLSGDTSTLEKVFATDYTFTNPFGEVMTKDQILSELGSGTIKFQAWDLDDVHVRAYGNSAVARGHVRLKGQRQGQDISGEYRGTWHWVWNQGRWQLVAGQSTRVVGQPAMAGAAQTTAGSRTATKTTTRS